MMVKIQCNITLLLLLIFSAKVAWSCEGAEGRHTVDEARRFLRAFKQVIDIKNQLPVYKQCCQLTPPPGSSPAKTDTNRDVKEILYSLLVIKSKIEQICRNIETFTDNFFDSLYFIVSALYADQSPALCSKVELLEFELAVHDENIMKLLAQLRAIIMERVAQRFVHLEKVETSLLVQNEEIAALIKSITASLEVEQDMLSAQLAKMYASLSYAFKTKVADVQQLSRERFVQTLNALLKLQEQVKKELEALNIGVASLYQAVRDQIDQSMDGLIGVSTAKGEELIAQLKNIALSLSAQIQTSCVHVAQALTAYEQSISNAIEKTGEQALVQKIGEIETVSDIQLKGTVEHQAIKAQIVELGINTVNTLQKNEDVFCEVLGKEVVRVNHALDQFERDIFGRIEAEFDSLTRIVEEHTHDGKADLLTFETHLVRSLARDFCGLDEKIAIGLSDICSDIVQFDAQIAAQSGKISRLLAKIEGNLSGKVCIKMSTIEKDQVLNRNRLANLLGDFRAVGASQICADIVSTQAHLDGQADALSLQQVAVESSTRAFLDRELAATEALLQGYYVSLCSKVGALDTGVCAAILHEFGASDAELSNKLSAIYQKALMFETDVSGAISSDFTDLQGNIQQNEAIICGKIADFRAQAIDNVNALCEKFSNVKVNTILALSDVEQAVLEKLARLDAALQSIAISISTINGLAKGLRPII